MLARVRTVISQGLGIMLAASFATSCYNPDLSTQILKCDRGKCPDGLYCIDNVYCSAPLLECSVGGIKVSDEVFACLSLKSPIDLPNICAGDTSAARCDMKMVSKDLCRGISTCAYCCK